VTRLIRWVLPAACLVCGERGDGEADLCHACRTDLPWNDSACARCALPLPAPAPACGACLTDPPPLSAAWAALRYEAPIDRLLPRFKFHAGLAEGRLLAALMAERLPAGLLDGVDLVVPMPLHRTRLGRRGYNQALELALPLLRATPRPLAVDALRRVRATPPQSELDAAGRRRNVRGAFEADASRVQGRCVLLVDDVITTGATIAEAAQTLIRAGAREVRALAVARALRPGAR
jgi:ComF family protein